MLEMAKVYWKFFFWYSVKTSCMRCCFVVGGMDTSEILEILPPLSLFQNYALLCLFSLSNTFYYMKYINKYTVKEWIRKVFLWHCSLQCLDRRQCLDTQDLMEESTDCWFFFDMCQRCHQPCSCVEEQSWWLTAVCSYSRGSQ